MPQKKSSTVLVNCQCTALACLRKIRLAKATAAKIAKGRPRLYVIASSCVFRPEPNEVVVKRRKDYYLVTRE